MTAWHEAAEAQLVKVPALVEALDTLSRWPPHGGMMAMCEYARNALAAFEQEQKT